MLNKKRMHRVRTIKYLAATVQYPDIAKEKGIEGRVVVSFIVEKDGTPAGFEVVRGVDPSLNEEAIRALSTMGRWTPGEQNGKVVQVKYTVPVQFRQQ